MPSTHHNSQVNVLETDRLIVRELSVDDAPFMLRLLNEPSFIQNIGDRNVRTLEDAKVYIQNKPMAHYERFGFGLYLVADRTTESSIGVCGLLQRESLAFPDVGYALLPEYWGSGYALEAASAVLSYGRKVLGMSRILAIANADNAPSIRVLQKLGFSFSKMVQMEEDGDEVALFVSDPVK